jgi:restriction endonuclease S subunit
MINMAVYSAIKLSELEGAKRIDAEYYKPEYLKLSSKIISKGYSKLGNISSLLTDGDHGNPEYSTEGIVYVTSENLNGLGVDIKGCNKISYEYAKKIRKDCFTTEGDILLTTVGKIGISTIAQLSGIALSRDIARIVIEKNTFYPEFISVYLNSRIGLSLTERESVGSVQKGLYLVQIRNLKIPKISNILQDKIKHFFLNAIKFYKQSLSFYSQAENLLLEELGLKDLKPRYEKTYTANLSSAFSVHRIDAEYFQPAYEEIEKHLIKKFFAKPIKKLNFIDVTTGQYSEKYVDKSKGLPYIRGTDLKNGTINTDDLVYISPEDQIEGKKAKEGDVVVTRVGTIGLSARIPQECEGGTISDNLIRLRFDQQKLNSYYLALFLGSPLGANLMIKNSRGSVQQRLNQETLKEVVIPLLLLETQQKIASLVQQSHEARRKAKELLEVAKKAVEVAIEKGEKEALNYISKAEDKK